MNYDKIAVLIPAYKPDRRLNQLVDDLLALAKEQKIAAQCEILPYGGTDTSAVQMTGYGCRAGALSIPTRYIHSGVEMIDLRDVKATVDLTVAYLRGER